MTRSSQIEICPGCGVALPPGGGEGHAYLGAAPSCWSLFERVLAREYADPAYFRAHRITVDAYAAQHPGKPEPRTIQSIHVHLTGLYLTLERGAEPAFTRRAIAVVTREKARLRWLTPPVSTGGVTVAEVSAAATAEEHHARVTAWGWSVWEAWSQHHRSVADMAAEALASL